MITVLCVNIAHATQHTFRRLYEKASAERKQRAEQYLRQEDALRCLAAEALLRLALEGEAVTLEKTPEGKPWVRERPDFHFNISHSGDWVVLAWGGSPVGVDVQQHSGIDRRAVARRWFSPEEQGWLAENDTQEAFYRVWTGKESYLKYLGIGLRRPMNTFSVLSLEEPVHLFRETLPADYSLCLCTEEEAWQLRVIPLEAIL